MASGRARSGPVARPGKVVTLAVLGNLLFATGLGFVVAPVGMSEATLDAYDGLPGPLRGWLGDRETTESGEASFSTTGSATRGPVGRFLESFLQEAVQGDPEAQAEQELRLVSDRDPTAWHPNGTVRVSWTTYDEPLVYNIAVATEGGGPDPLIATERTVEDVDHVDLELGDGIWTIGVRASYGDVVGPLATIGPFRVDSSAPVPPTFNVTGVLRLDVYSYNIEWAPAMDDSGIKRYIVERSIAGGAFVPVHEVSGDTTKVLEHNRPNGDYQYRVRAQNGAGLVSEPSAPLDVVVDARGGLTPPGPGTYDFGIHAVYDSVLLVYDISDPSKYLDRSDLPAGLSAEEYDRYLSSGWGIETKDPELRRIAAQVLGAQDVNGKLVGGEENTLEIGKKLFAWLYDATDYDFDKFASAQPDFQRATETLELGKGICGDLTALYITMMRIAGVPARPVHGYLINRGEGDDGLAIGGFHMWAEIYVGGDDPVGGGWIPVDVSGVTGSFEPKHLDFYFGVGNPAYLQLGVQEDLGDDSLPLEENGEEPLANRWNIWANLQWYYRSRTGDTTSPEITFEADEAVTEIAAQDGWLFFDDQTHRRVFCETLTVGGEERLEDDDCPGGLRSYYKGLKGSSKRTIDHGADIRWSDTRVTEVELMLKYPDRPAPSQAVMYTVYERAADCSMVERDPATLDRGTGFLFWTIDGEEARCTA